MQAFWITFKGRSSACIQADDEASAVVEAATITGCEVTRCHRLPYPASPRLNEPINPNTGEVTPDFCYKPGECAGRSSCPQNYSCTE